MNPEAAFVVVLGLYRSGSSCLAGVLHHLGVFMGNRFHQPGREDCPRGSFEAAALCALCWRAYRQPSIERAVPQAWLVRALSGWFHQHCDDAQQLRRPVAGAKHPLLCAMADELLMVAPGIKFIDICRPLDVSIRSLQARGWWGATPAQCADLQCFLWTQKQRCLRDVCHLQIDYQALLARPETEIHRIIEYLCLDPDPQRIDNAVAFIEPRWRRF